MLLVDDPSAIGRDVFQRPAQVDSINAKPVLGGQVLVEQTERKNTG